MFDNFFNNQPKYLYDVKNTLSRSASALLDRGVQLRGGDNACTDGTEVIYLPQAMRRRLAWNEIDFVRYLVLHEMAHIEHSEPKGNVLAELPYHQSTACVINCLEDLRIEALEMRQMVGFNTIITNGRRMACEMWRRKLSEYKEKGENPAIESALSHVIFMGGISSEFRKPTGHKSIDALIKLFTDHMIFDDIDLVCEQPERFEKTSDLAPLAARIIRLLPSRPHDEDGYDQQQWGEGLGQERGTADNSNWGDGAIERAAEELEVERGEDGKPTEEAIGEGDLASDSGNGLNLGRRSDENYINKIAGAENYEWARHACAQAGPLVNALRGEARRGYSTPRDSGVRIAQRQVVPFLLGSTNNVLRRRISQPHNGTSVLFLVDDSGSMAGSGQENLAKPAWRGAAMLAMACERAKIRSMIVRYSDNAAIDKAFGDPLVKQRERMAGGYEGGTDLGAGIKLAQTYLERETNPRRVLFILCDGCTYDERSTIHTMRQSGIETYPVLFGEYAMEMSVENRCWDIDGCVKIPNPNQTNLGAELITKMITVI